MLNLPKPCGTLTVAPGRISLRLRPRFLAAGRPGSPWLVTAEQRVQIFPVRGSAFKRGVGFEVGSAKPYYFWCGRALPDVLQAIEAAGFAVTMVERRPEFR